MKFCANKVHKRRRQGRPRDRRGPHRRFRRDPAKIGALVEMRCESPSVVKNERFVKLANDLAEQVAVKNPANVEELLASAVRRRPKETVTDRIGEVVGLIRENMKVGPLDRFDGSRGQYVHHDGTVGVLIAGRGRQGRGICCGMSACTSPPGANPLAARREDVSADEIAKEKEIARPSWRSIRRTRTSRRTSSRRSSKAR